ncbi:hypothetical protein EFK68_02985 [Pseudomonas aeruginosa]|uniref:hypothetical protein n=1 Tax=Pseudomonas aeruginosa TaxID=287 RepID=UPI000F6B2B4A|nr:hypothetical protein [Pseudomonas aeruginosa]EKF7416711.1 hypothetical protein [Pseudomonas aeruginosa]RNF58370.1 hypothetical protein EFK68_02985 [Pseudomonas aeruginosa]CAI9794617.1 (Fe-S)-binding protein [Pseudomonas aeruginosa]CAI9912006.1 (Fe-S)-binding protein [Pseudomonas aeruginosa]HBO1617628.1 hypothetical protein [Pseudomonas aeruginosa]
MSIKQVLVISAHATSEYGDGPQIAVYPDAAELLMRVQQMYALVEANQLSEVRMYCSPNWGPVSIEEELRLTCGELVVSSNVFYFTDSPKHADYKIETDPKSINQLEEWVASGAKEIFACGGLVEAYRQFQEEQAEEQGEGDQ